MTFKTKFTVNATTAVVTLAGLVASLGAPLKW